MSDAAQFSRRPDVPSDDETVLFCASFSVYLNACYTCRVNVHEGNLNENNVIISIGAAFFL